MKTLAIASFAVLISALASTAMADTSPSTGLTRAQVRAQLVQAERNGTIPTNNVDYPPSAAQIARNRAVYQAQFGKSNEPQQWLQQSNG
ncbi:DUF4148 domain-containing protein [Pararobbsia alpina]|uniref:DUF4148 domain-containing protein n=1 Tax=Pararobbsia alpina TaxID=621374 RepID=A0A6S7BSM3_9BURK|nr:DUF4148 domain-containing protein [Pararobbsia alpina]CAB3798079.1 hypothetical protein LMG28138_04376 [Pararobbsia alpina]